MNHKARLLWIFLQCAAALLSLAVGEKAVLKGKKWLCLLSIVVFVYYIHFYHLFLSQPQREVSKSNITCREYMRSMNGKK